MPKLKMTLCICWYAVVHRKTAAFKYTLVRNGIPGFHLEKKCLGVSISQHEVPCDFLEGVAHCTLLISEHQSSSGVTCI